MTDPTSRAYAEQLDATDALASYRGRFEIPDDSVVYLDGNSLGRLPAATAGRVAQVIHEQWGERLIRSWSEGWMDLPVQVGDRLGAALLGARPGETLVSDTVTVNAFKALHAALDLRPGRSTIVAHRGEFPTDRYVATEVARQRGGSVRWIGPLDPDATQVDPVTASDVAAALNDDVGVVLLSVVDYRSAAIADVVGITRAAHDFGALVVWDCSHAAGSIPLDLPALDADLAIGCSYKYLNGGPGAPGVDLGEREAPRGAEQPDPRMDGAQRRLRHGAGVLTGDRRTPLHDGHAVGRRARRGRLRRRAARRGGDGRRAREGPGADVVRRGPRRRLARRARRRSREPPRPRAARRARDADPPRRAGSRAGAQRPRASSPTSATPTASGSASPP